VLIDIETSAIQRIIMLQYNPDTLTRIFRPQGVGGESGSRLWVKVTTKRRVSGVGSGSLSFEGR